VTYTPRVRKVSGGSIRLITAGVGSVPDVIAIWAGRVN